MIVRHPKCGQSWRSGGNRVGHCSSCCRTFDGLAAFDRHQTVAGGVVTCHDPATLVSSTGRPVFSSRTGGAGPDEGHIYWRLVPTERDMERLARLKARRRSASEEQDA